MKKEKFGNLYYELCVSLDKRINPLSIKDKVAGLTFADKNYRYHLKLSSDSETLESEGLMYKEHSITDDDGAKKVVLSGVIEGSDVEVEHLFLAPHDAPYFEEYITLRNTGGKRYQVEDISFGFRKKFEEALHPFHLVAVPYKKQVDRKRHDYSMQDIREGKFENSNWMNDPTVLGQQDADTEKARSEGWVWTDEKSGLLITKYNNEMVEYSMVAKDECDGDACMRFGGVGFCLFKEPRQATALAPGEEISFGLTRYTFFKGGWKEGYYKFREFMNEKGHGIPETYNPPVNWNELFDVGWYHSNREELFKHYTLDALYHEAEKAKELGCELLYLDPGWGICEGTTLWDEERLGKLTDFVKTLKEKYGLELGYRTIGRVYRDEFPHEWYIQRKEEEIEYTRPLQKDGNPIPFWEVCTQCEEWKQEKLKRILAIKRPIEARSLPPGAGIKFMMFDEFDWRGPCYNKSHGHPVPSTPEGHIRAIYWLIEEVHKRYPDVLIEAHEPVWPWQVRYSPTYYRQSLITEGYDENWGFEFMWNPIQNLISGEALCLYYYNLGSEVPLYDHITMEGDNDNCLSFWWYASTIRHLGIGGKKGLSSKEDNEVRYQAYKKAMAEYMKLKDFYTRGKFYGIDELTHVHTLPGKKGIVINAFNLSNEPVSKEVTLDLKEIGVDLDEHASIEGATGEQAGKKVILSLDIPAMGPILVKIGV